MVKWVWFCIASSIFIGLVMFIGCWIFHLPLVAAIPLSWVVYGLLIFLATRKVEAKHLVMHESKWLDVEGDKE